MNHNKILLIEDDKEISEMLKNYLTVENYEVFCAYDGQEACDSFDRTDFSLVLLDLMIPKISGMDVMQHIRKNSVVPLIIISAKDSETDKTLGLSLGADDYITKPFSVVEVSARIKANIRRRNQYDKGADNTPERLTAGELVMNLSDYTLAKNGKRIELTAKEYEILKLFMQNPKKVYTKEQIYSLVWNDAYLGDENETTVIFFLSICIGLLVCIVLYQHYVFHTGTQAKLREISGKLKEIIEIDSDEQIMVFTENKELIELAAQINDLLEKHLKTKAVYRRSEIASKKMLTNISHDIKTPMTVILGYLEIMQLSETASSEILKKVADKAQDVMKMINQFFTLSKIESGDMDIGLSRVDICEACRESILDFYELLSNKEFQVVLNIPETPVLVQGNKVALQCILFNLISNVIRYGADGKYLEISLRNEEKNVYVDVTDNGKGIDKIFSDSIFDRLFTMEDSRNRKIQGNGLGLTIAKNLAVRLGGTITLESIPYIRTTFTIQLKKISF